MGSSCSSGQKKDKERQNAAGGQSPIGGRRLSTESIPYGRRSPPSRRPSFDPNSAPAPVAETAESPGEVTKTPVGPAPSHASVGERSSSSPPPTGLGGTPVTKDAPGLDIAGLPDLQQFPEQVRFMLLGQISKVECLPPLQEIALYVSADFYDSAVERNFLAEKVFPTLRRYTAERGYELNIMDLHWGVPGVGIVDHCLRDLCIETLEKWRTRRRLLTLQDGGPPHYVAAVCRWLDGQFPGHWIGRYGPIAWPPRSPDLTPLDFYLWGHLKAMVYQCKIHDRHYLQLRILEACSKIITDILHHVHADWQQRLRQCVARNGEHFEHIK